MNIFGCFFSVSISFVVIFDINQNEKFLEIVEKQFYNLAKKCKNYNKNESRRRFGPPY